MIRRPKTAVGLCALAGAAMLAACAPEPVSRPPQVVDPWIRLAPPGARMMAGYLVLENPGDQPQELVAVSSPDFASIEVHRTEIVDGVARMIPEPDLTVPAGGRAVFEPGGRHLMLHGPARDLSEGDTVALSFGFADGGRIDLTAPVRRGSDPGDGAAHDHHDH
jgi:hypothetical protein